MIVTTHLCDVYRLVKTGATESYDVTPVITGLDCGIIPAGPDLLAVYPGIPSFALYEIFFEEVNDLKNGDKLVSGSDSWILRGVPQVFDNDYTYFVRFTGEKQP